MARVDPWQKAAECERAVQTEIDRQQQAILIQLRNLWIALADESKLMSADDLATAVEAIDLLHQELINPHQHICH